MLIHGIDNLGNAQNLHARTLKAPAKPIDTGSLSDAVESSYQPIKTPATAVAAAPTGFAALFSNYNPNNTIPATTTSSPPVPFAATFEQGAYVSGLDGSRTSLNPVELASETTAQQVAALLGGTVVNSSLGGSFVSSVPTREIIVPGSNVQINAGLAANLFATYGTAPGSQAWLTINRDLGRDPLSTGPVS